LFRWLGWTIARTVSINGCWYLYHFCYRINPYTGFHEISVNDISILTPCDSSNFESNPNLIKDSILIDIGLSGFLESEWGLIIPLCPNQLCLLTLYDDFCYNGWTYNGPPDPPDFSPNIEYMEQVYLWTMNKCDEELRSCNETILYCWEIINGDSVLMLWKEGYPTGPPCPLDTVSYLPNCKRLCDY